MFFKKQNPYIKEQKQRIAYERVEAWESLRHQRRKFMRERDPEKALTYSKNMTFWANKLVKLDDEERELKQLAKCM